MLLILTNSLDATADYLVEHLRASSIDFARLDTDTFISNGDLAYRVGIPELTIDGRALKPNDIRHVWYRRPERLLSEGSVDSPESIYTMDEWSEALNGFLAHVPAKKWMNHPSSNVQAGHKLHQLTLAHELGLATPQTLVTQNGAAARDFWKQHRNGIIAKPMAAGEIEREPPLKSSLIYTNLVDLDDIVSSDELVHCPTLFQEFVNKASEVRITVVDEAMHAVNMVSFHVDGSARCDVRYENMRGVTYTPCEVPLAVSNRLLALMAHYDLRFGAIDMLISNTGDWIFLEINPNGQWAWLDMEAGTEIWRSMIRSFEGNLS